MKIHHHTLNFHKHRRIAITINIIQWSKLKTENTSKHPTSQPARRLDTNCPLSFRGWLRSVGNRCNICSQKIRHSYNKNCKVLLMCHRSMSVSTKLGNCSITFGCLALVLNVAKNRLRNLALR